MTSFFIEYWKILFSAFFLGVSHRERGQGHEHLGTQMSRILFWATPVTISFLILKGLHYEVGAQIWILALFSMILLPHAAGQNLNIPFSGPTGDSFPSVSFPERLGYLWLSGMGRLMFLEIALRGVSAIDAPWLVLGGLFMPVGYLLGLIMPLLPWRLTTKQEWGEFLSGIIFGVFFSFRVLEMLPNFPIWR